MSGSGRWELDFFGAFRWTGIDDRTECYFQITVSSFSGILRN
jgi:hypothetical protein